MSSLDTATDALRAERRLAALLHHAPLEFARVVYGINDLASGRYQTVVAQDVLRTERQNGMTLTRDRAEQRARAYLPVGGHEHCPRCWVLLGAKSPLAFTRAEDGMFEIARCRTCEAEYGFVLD